MAEAKKTTGIHKAMLAVMAKIRAIGKDQRASGAGTFNFRGIDDVYNTMHGIFVDCEILVLPEVIDHSVIEVHTSTGKPIQLATVRVRYNFYTADGSCISAIAAGAATDGSGRGLAQAQSDAFKQCIFKSFCIPTKADEDAETTMDEVADPATTEAWDKTVQAFGYEPAIEVYNRLYPQGPFVVESLKAVYAELQELQKGSQ